MRGGIPVQRNLLRNTAFLDRLLQEPLGRDNIATFAQEKINGLSFPIHRAVQVHPSSFNSNVRFIAPPRGTHRSAVTLPTLGNFRAVPLDPAHNSSMGQI